MKILQFRNLQNTQALRVINLLCGNVAKGNCRGRKQTIDLNKGKKPLAKRQRLRAKKLKCDKISKDYVDTSTAMENEVKHEFSELSSDAMSGYTNKQLRIIENATTIAEETLTSH